MFILQKCNYINNDINDFECECIFSIDIFSFKYVVLIGPNHFEIQRESGWMRSVTYILCIRRVCFKTVFALAYTGIQSFVSSFVCCGYLPFS